MYGGAQSVLVTVKSFFINLLCCRFYLLTYCRLTRIMPAFFAGRSSVPSLGARPHCQGQRLAREDSKNLSPPPPPPPPHPPPSASLLIFSSFLPFPFLFPFFFLFSPFSSLFFLSSFLISLPFFSIPPFSFFL